MNAISKIREIKDFLDDHGIESAGREAEILIKHCAGIDTVDIYRDNPIITEHCSDFAERLARRRASREPLAYILGLTRPPHPSLYPLAQIGGHIFALQLHLPDDTCPITLFAISILADQIW